MIVDIKAKFSCDDCGTEFIVDLDPANVPSGSLFEAAENSIRGGLSYEDGRDEQFSDAIGCVTRDDRHLCDKCRRVYDAK